jgi:hypothetical protein
MVNYLRGESTKARGANQLLTAAVVDDWNIKSKRLPGSRAPRESDRGVTGPRKTDLTPVAPHLREHVANREQWSLRLGSLVLLEVLVEGEYPPLQLKIAQALGPIVVS